MIRITKRYKNIRTYFFVVCDRNKYLNVAVFTYSYASSRNLDGIGYVIGNRCTPMTTNFINFTLCLFLSQGTNVINVEFSSHRCVPITEGMTFRLHPVKIVVSFNIICRDKTSYEMSLHS